MNKPVWIIVVLIFAAIIATVALVVYLNFGHPQADSLIDIDDIPIPPPPEVTFTDEQIVRFEVQLSDDDPGLRLDAIAALNNAVVKHTESVAPILTRALANEDPRVRGMAAIQLGSIKYTSAADEIAGLLDDSEKDVIAAAARALTQLQDVGLKAVMDRLSENTLENTDKALYVITQITGRSFPQGPQGRQQALEFWAQYKSKP